MSNTNTAHGLRTGDRALLKEMLAHLEDMTQRDRLPKWERHALRAAYMAIDAVKRQDISGVSHVEICVEQALAVLHDPTTLEGAAQILYGHLPGEPRV